MIMIIGKEFKATKNTLVIFWKRYCEELLSSNVSKIPIEVLFLVATFNALPVSINIIAIIIIILLHSLNEFKECNLLPFLPLFFRVFVVKFCPYFTPEEKRLAVRRKIRKPQVAFVFAGLSS